jgi:ankyrin repeat protein
MIAAGNGDVSISQLLIENASAVNVQNKVSSFIFVDVITLIHIVNCQRGETALMYAARSGSNHIAHLLIDHGCIVNTRDDVSRRTSYT